MSGPGTPVELDEAERRLLRNALQTYLSDFGHEDHELIVATKRLLDKLTAADAAAATLRTTEAAG
jgi:hypothetical protein